MDYTTWRITYQSSEQAAQAAYKSAQQHLQHVENLRYAGNRVIRGGEGTHVWDLALKALPEDSPLHTRIAELEEQASQAAAEREALTAYAARLRGLGQLVREAATDMAHIGTEELFDRAEKWDAALLDTPETSLARLLADKLPVCSKRIAELEAEVKELRHQAEGAR